MKIYFRAKLSLSLSPLPSLPFFLFRFCPFSFYLFLTLVIDYLARTSVLRTVPHCRINLETDSRRVMPMSLTVVTLLQYNMCSR